MEIVLRDRLTHQVRRSRKASDLWSFGPYNVGEPRWLADSWISCKIGDPAQGRPIPRVA